MAGSRPRFLFAWRHALASTQGPSSSVARLVALTLALYMDREGQSAWPSQDTMATRTALTDRTVGRALEQLCADGWLERQARKSPKGNRHRRFGYEYRARLPRTLADAYAKDERASLFNGTEPGDVEALPVVRPNDGNTESGDTRMANAVRTNTSFELAKTAAINKEGLRPRQPNTGTAAAHVIADRRAGLNPWVAEYEVAERLAA